MFFVGMYNVAQAAAVGPAFVSVRRLENRRSDFEVGDWVMDSGAFSTIAVHGGYPRPPEEYAAQVRRWARCGRLLAAVTQDYMCEPHMLRRTGRTVRQHQAMTVARYDRIVRAVRGAAYVMPVLQGWAPEDYARHVGMYGRRLRRGAWVGVGSVCRRNRDPRQVEAVLRAVLAVRPDLRLHGFGVKITSLRSPEVRRMLHSADSMAWCFNASINGRDHHDPAEPRRFAERVRRMCGIGG